MWFISSQIELHCTAFLIFTNDQSDHAGPFGSLPFSSFVKRLGCVEMLDAFSFTFSQYPVWYIFIRMKIRG